MALLGSESLHMVVIKPPIGFFLNRSDIRHIVSAFQSSLEEDWSLIRLLRSVSSYYLCSVTLYPALPTSFWVISRTNIPMD